MRRLWWITTEDPWRLDETLIPEAAGIISRKYLIVEYIVLENLDAVRLKLVLECANDTTQLHSHNAPWSLVSPCTTYV
jgi:hypothetical protein